MSYASHFRQLLFGIQVKRTREIELQQRNSIQFRKSERNKISLEYNHESIK